MTFSNLFRSGKHSRHLGHFAAIVTLAAADGQINSEEEKILKQLASKLDINEIDYEEVLKNPSGYPLTPSFTAEGRLERLYDLFRVIFADNKIEKEEHFLIEKYAIALGYSASEAEKLIDKSISIFSGKVSFEDYQYLMKKS